LFFSKHVYSESITLAQNDNRSIYPFELLKLALQKTQSEQDPDVFNIKSENVTQGRLEKLLSNQKIDIAYLPTDKNRESEFIAVKVPIYRGMLGYRVLFINKKKEQEFAQLTTFSQFQEMTAGFGTHWTDIKILKSNGINVISTPYYRGLFEMLRFDRFDYIPRGIPEASEEYIEFSKLNKNLFIEESIGLYYPFYVYFFVSKQAPGLALRIERGLNALIEDGTFQTLFLKHFQKNILTFNIPSRKTFHLTNNYLPEGTAVVDTQWWLKSHK
jgi:hypothetical protein